MKKLKLIRNAPVSLLAGLAVVSLLGAGSAFAYSEYNITTVSGITGNVMIGGEAQSGANYANLDNGTPGTQTPFTSGGLSVSFNANGAIGPGGFGSGAPPADPYLSGNNNMFFEASTPVGLDTTPFIYAGNGAGSATMSFTGTQNYLGLLWGSIDFAEGAGGQHDNVLTFYSGANGTGSVVATIDGLDIANTDGQIDADLTSDGNVGITGTAYVNLDVAGGFQSVVASSGNFTFEMDNIAYADYGSGVPDGGITAALLGSSMLVLGALRRRLNRG